VGASGSRIWKNAPVNPHHAFILADPDSELDDRAFGVPTRIRGKTEKHAPLEMF